MSWKHIAVEGYCLYKLKGKDENEVPSYCQLGPGNVGLQCFSLINEEKRVCPYFGFGKARTSLILVDETGESIDSKIFWADEDLNNETEWLKKEQIWINRWKNKMRTEE